MPLPDLARTVISMNGLLPDSPQSNFLLELLKNRAPSGLLRYVRSGTSNIDQWKALFGICDLQPGPSQSAIESAAISAAHRREFIQIFQRSLTHVNTTITLDKNLIWKRLHIDAETIDFQTQWNSHEIELLRNIRLQQEATPWPWSHSDAVTTILYNVIVQRNENSRLPITARSYGSIEKKIRSGLAANDTTLKEPLFVINHPKPSKQLDFTIEEKYLVAKLFDILSQIDIKNRKQQFHMLWHFASCTTAEIYSRSVADLDKKWSNSLRQGSRKSVNNFPSILDDVLLDEAPTNPSEYLADLSLLNETDSLLAEAAVFLNSCGAISPPQDTNSLLQQSSSLESASIIRQQPVPLSIPLVQSQQTTRGLVSSEDWEAIATYAGRISGSNGRWDLVREFATAINSKYAAVNSNGWKQRYMRHQRELQHLHAKLPTPPTPTNHSPAIRTIAPDPSIASVASISTRLIASQNEVEPDTASNNQPNSAIRSETAFLKKTKQKSCVACVKRKKSCNGSQKECAKRPKHSHQP
ncbi:hypothetical protein BDR26DRAFT_916250, partial [Obelidium mucronatum]